jgi:hypothetical protein
MLHRPGLPINCRLINYIDDSKFARTKHNVRDNGTSTQN